MRRLRRLFKMRGENEVESASYKYSPLPSDHIRLLSFTSKAVALDDPGSISCSLESVAFQVPTSVPQFEALTYTWGSLDETYPIICNGKILRIHCNLYEALPYLASRSSDLPLWIDAICINQSDDTEKLDQITRMSGIYRNAIRVVAWLGVGKEPWAREAAETIFPRVQDTLEQLQVTQWNQRLRFHELKLPGPDALSWDAFFHITRNPWYLRLWVMQEAAMARELVFFYGPYQIDENSLQVVVQKERFLTCVRDEWDRALKQMTGPIPDQSIIFECRRIYNEFLCSATVQEVDLQRVISMIWSWTQFTYCSEPRDRVLALLGFLGDHLPQSIPLLRGHRPVNKLYTGWIQLLLSFEHDDVGRTADHVLYTAVGQRREGIRLPSWCPDLHTQLDGPEQDLVRYVRRIPFRASARKWSASEGATQEELVVHGIMFDDVLNIGPGMSLLPTPTKWSESIERIVKFHTWEVQATNLAQSLFADDVSLAQELWQVWVGEHLDRYRTTHTVGHYQLLQATVAEAMIQVKAIGLSRCVLARFQAGATLILPEF